MMSRTFSIKVKVSISCYLSLVHISRILLLLYCCFLFIPSSTFSSLPYLHPFVSFLIYFQLAQYLLLKWFPLKEILCNLLLNHKCADPWSLFLKIFSIPANRTFGILLDENKLFIDELTLNLNSHCKFISGIKFMLKKVLFKNVYLPIFTDLFVPPTSSQWVKGTVP